MKYMKYKKLYCLLFQSIRYETTKTMSRPHKGAYTCKAYNNACRVCSRIVVKPCADSIATSHRLLRTSCRLYAQSFPRQTCTVLHTLKLYNRPNMYRPVVQIYVFGMHSWFLIRRYAAIGNTKKVADSMTIR